MKKVLKESEFKELLSSLTEAVIKEERLKEEDCVSEYKLFISNNYEIYRELKKFVEKFPSLIDSADFEEKLLNSKWFDDFLKHTTSLYNEIYHIDFFNYTYTEKYKKDLCKVLVEEIRDIYQ